MRIQFVLFLLIIYSCNSSQQKEQVESKNNKNDSIIPIKEEIVLVDSSKIPSRTLLKLVDFINVSNYIHDTSFIRKVGMYRYSDSIFNVDDKLFYYLKPEQTLILDFCRITKEPGFEEPNIFKENLYNKASHVFAYYYRENFKDEFVNDGFIEEWYFADSTQAEKARLDFISKNQHLIFNTSSFGHRKNNKLYILYTRAAGFGIYLDKVYQHLKTLK